MQNSTVKAIKQISNNNKIIIISPFQCNQASRISIRIIINLVFDPKKSLNSKCKVRISVLNLLKGKNHQVK